MWRLPVLQRRPGSESARREDDSARHLPRGRRARLWVAVGGRVPAPQCCASFGACGQSRENAPRAPRGHRQATRPRADHRMTSAGSVLIPVSPKRHGGPRRAAGPRRRWTPPPSAPRRLLSLADTASYLGMTPWSVRTLVSNGTLPVVKLTRRLLFDQRDLDKLIERSKETC
jgi:Helix-turn-helix domain